jgi:hypothetical protein
VRGRHGIAFGREAAAARRVDQVTVIRLGMLTGPEAVCIRMRRVAREREPLGGKIVVDLAIGRRVPGAVIGDRRGPLAGLVLPEQMADLVNHHGGVFFDRVRGHPALVVVEPPV